jgi:hypothetical protein
MVQDSASPQQPILENSLSTLLQADLEWARLILLSKYSHRRRRPPYPPEAMLKALIYQRLKQIQSWRKLALTISADRTLMMQLGFQRPPTYSSFSTFTKRVGDDTFRKIFEELVQRLRYLIPDLGNIVAVDATLVKGYSRPGRKGMPKTDPDAAWGYSGEKQGKPMYTYGYKLQVISDCMREIPVSFHVEPANRSENRLLCPHLNAMLASGTEPEVLVADAGYDSRRNTISLIREGIRPIIALNPRGKKGTKRFRRDYLLPIARHSDEWERYYATRSAAERVFSRLKGELGLTDVKLRTKARVTVHFALCLIAMVLVAYVSFAVGRPELYLSVEPWRY